MQISVLLPTFRRANALRHCLAAIARSVVRRCRWELIVVDNAGDKETSDVCASFNGVLPIRVLVCMRPGKSAALNYGLSAATGELVVLTDDDVLPEEGWLDELCQGAKRWPQHVLFGGRILP